MPGKLCKQAAGALHDLGGRIIALCVVIFLADVVFGFFVTSYPIFARQAGMTLPAIGAVSAVSGGIQLAAALPIGLISDRLGRHRFISAGVLVISLNMFVMAAGPGPWLLLLCPLLNGFALTAVFQLGQAHLGDLTSASQRPLAYGLFSTAMGLGFGVGPYCGGLLVDRYGFSRAYLLVGAVGCAGFLLAVASHRRREAARRVHPGGLLAGVRLMIGQPDLRLVAFGNLLLGVAFTGILSTFLPLYCKSLLFSQAAIGSMFVVRSLVSAAGRIANGLLVRRMDNLFVMVAALLLIDLAVFGIGAATRPGTMMAFLALEGLAYGSFMVAGLTYVANHTTAANRGAAGGVYAMASGVGGAVSSWFLGLVAQWWGLRAVFFVTGAALAVGVAIVIRGVAALRRGDGCASGKEDVSPVSEAI